MTQLKLQELDVSIGDIVVCVSEGTHMFTNAVEYEVEQAPDGKLGLMTDCGFIATTSASLFTPLSMMTNELDSDDLMSDLDDESSGDSVASPVRPLSNNDNFNPKGLRNIA